MNANQLPKTIRVALEARPTDWEVASGVTISGYGYNGQVPGPVIEAIQGVPVEIEFTNNLSEPTLIHWHGLRIPAAMDGTQATQRPVAPGETFTYRKLGFKRMLTAMAIFANQAEAVRTGLVTLPRLRTRKVIGDHRTGETGIREHPVLDRMTEINELRRHYGSSSRRNTRDIRDRRMCRRRS